MRRVDLPTPGSPPTRTRLPGTIPPPSTRFSSPHARRRRGAESAEIWVTGTGAADELPEVAPRPLRDSVLRRPGYRSEEHTSELQSHSDLVCRLLLEKKKK